jgi:hypothetical protein
MLGHTHTQIPLHLPGHAYTHARRHTQKFHTCSMPGHTHTHTQISPHLPGHAHTHTHTHAGTHRHTQISHLLQSRTQPVRWRQLLLLLLLLLSVRRALYSAADRGRQVTIGCSFEQISTPPTAVTTKACAPTSTTSTQITVCGWTGAVCAARYGSRGGAGGGGGKGAALGEGVGAARRGTRNSRS